MPKAPWQTLNNRRTPPPLPFSPKNLWIRVCGFKSRVTVYCITCMQYGSDINLLINVHGCLKF